MLRRLFRKKLEGTPGEVLNWRLGYSVMAFGLLGAARGLDEGLIGTTLTQPSFRQKFGLGDSFGGSSTHEQRERLSNIASMLQLGSLFGALVGFYLTDKLGRLWTTRQLCPLWILGISLFLASGMNGNLAMLYSGRFIAGFGIGQTTVVAPAYLAETAPQAIRGLCVTFFSGSVYVGIVLGYFASYGTSIHISPSNQAQWIIPNSMHIMFACLTFFSSFLALESPRWLLNRDREEEAIRTLEKLRGLPLGDKFLDAEIAQMLSAKEKTRALMGRKSKWSLVHDLFRTKPNRYRLMLSVASQLLSQWSGAGTITIYAPQYFAMLGAAGQEKQLFATAMFGVTKFIPAMICTIFLVDFIGRKRSLMSGISLQFVGMLYMAIFLAANRAISEQSLESSRGQKIAAIWAVVMVYICGFGWALGWNSIQYLINSEIYPLNLRAIGGSIAMTIHFANQFGSSKAVPHMFHGMGQSGALFFFSATTLLGFFWVLFFLPELTGMSLESIEQVFDLPWHRVGLYGHKVRSGDDPLASSGSTLPGRCGGGGDDDDDDDGVVDIGGANTTANNRPSPSTLEEGTARRVLQPADSTTKPGHSTSA